MVMGQGLGYLLVVAICLGPSCIADTHSMKVAIGNETFATKAAAKAYAMKVLAKYAGRRIEKGAEDFPFVSALWCRSPSWDDGYSSFEVGKKFSGICVVALAGDGRRIDWSIRAAVSGRHVGRWTQLTVAMRLAIRPQILDFRAANRGADCELCGSKNDRPLEVDHIVSFRSLMRGYLDGRAGVYPDEFQYSHSGWTMRPEDSAFKDGWIEHHQAGAHLRLLCSGCHLRVTKEARQRPVGPESDEYSSDSLSDRLDHLCLK